MNYSRTYILFSALLLIFASTLLRAQPPEWVPEGIAALGQHATTRTEFNLDHSMLVLASKLDQDNEDLRHVIAGVNGVSVHSFRYPGPGMYDPQTLNAVRDQYRAAGWKRVAGNHNKDGGIGETDLWVRFDNNVVSNIAVLLAGENQVNFISVSGSISPIELLHLGGHFGIPKIESGVVVPAPGSAR